MYAYILISLLILDTLHFTFQDILHGKYLSALERLHVTESGFWNPRKICWGNRDSMTLESGIQLKKSGEIPQKQTIGIQNLSSADKD